MIDVNVTGHSKKVQVASEIKKRLTETYLFEH